MKKNIHGIISIILAFISLIIGIIAIAMHNWAIALIYGILLILGFLVVIYSYCTKCPSRFNCGHYILGKIAQWLPKRENSNYTIADIAGVILPMLFIVILPQPWLWKTTWMFATFWILLVIALVDITLFVCNKCLNTKCGLCRNKCLPNKKS